MKFNKKTITKVIIHVINIAYMGIFLANWIYEITVTPSSLRLIMSRLALMGLLAFLILAELFPENTLK
jgi:hypothetical protein